MRKLHMLAIILSIYSIHVLLKAAQPILASLMIVIFFCLFITFITTRAEDY